MYDSWIPTKTKETQAFDAWLKEEAVKHLRSNGLYNWQAMQPLADMLGKTTEAIRSRIRRIGNAHELSLPIAATTDHNFGPDLGDPLIFGGDAMVAGDFQIKTTSEYWIDRLIGVAQKHTIDTCITTGDFLNLSRFSDYTPTYRQPTFREEIISGRALLTTLLKYFKRVIVLPGNHEDRINKKTRGAIDIYGLIDMMRPHNTEGEIIVSHYDHCFVESDRGRWLITHGTGYRKLQLSLASTMADIEHCHIIHHHQHHAARGWSQSGEFEVIDNGGLFDTNMMGYVKLKKGIHAKMQNGFTRLQDGYATLYHSGTNWDEVLS